MEIISTSTGSLSEPYLQQLHKQELLNGVDFSSIESILADCKTLKLKCNETLIQVGEANNCLYLILSGQLRVHLASDMSNPVAILDAGQSVGEISIIDQQPASANVIADTECVLIMIEEQNLWQLVERSHAIARNLLLIMSQRLRYGNSMITKIKDLLDEYEVSATIDPLTNLYNRRWLDNTLHRVMHRCLTNHQPLSVIMIDIDYFKQYNDLHGHLAGDCALRAVSGAVLENLRPEDLVTRYGGEEFFALLPGLDLAAAHQVAERLRLAVEKTEIKQNNGRLLPPVCISIGVREMHGSDEPEYLIEMVDQALYRAKEAGRNIVSH